MKSFGRVFLRLVRPALVALIFLGAVWLLSRELKGFEYGRFLESLRQISGSEIGWALGLTALNYVVLFGYDFLAIRYLKHPISFGKLALASFVGNVASLNFGSLVGGSSIRYRFYSLWRFSTFEILQLIAILGITFWLGVCLLAGIVFLFRPFRIPERIAEQIPVTDIGLLGAVLIALVSGYLAICMVRRRPLKLLYWEIPLPPPWLSLGQIAVSCADLMVVAGVFYVLLPGGAETGYFKALGIFLLGWVVAAFSHVPGGVAVFELVMVTFLPELRKEEVTARALVFRTIYLLLPLTIAGGALLTHEVVLSRHLFARVAGLWRRRSSGAQAPISAASAGAPASPAPASPGIGPLGAGPLLRPQGENLDNPENTPQPEATEDPPACAGP